MKKLKSTVLTSYPPQYYDIATPMAYRVCLEQEIKKLRERKS